MPAPTYIEILDYTGLVDPSNLYKYGYLYSSDDELEEEIIYIEVANLLIGTSVVQSICANQIRVITDKEAFLLSMKDPVFREHIYAFDPLRR